MSHYVCSVAGLSEQDGSALSNLLHQLESELDATWSCSHTPAQNCDVELIDIDEELGRKLWRPQSGAFPLSVAYTGSQQEKADWLLPKPLDVDHVATLFRDLGDTLRPQRKDRTLPSILVAHSNSEVLKILADTMFSQRDRFRLITATSGQEAMQLLRMTNIALAIVVMPVRNGFELLASLADKHPEVLRLVCGGQGAGPWQIRVRSRTSFAHIDKHSPIPVLGEALLSVLDLKPAESGFLYTYSTWTSSWQRDTPPQPKPAPRQPTLREMLASEEVEFELSHLKQLAPLPKAEPPKPEKSQPRVEASYDELAEAGFAAFREKDYARAEQAWGLALQLKPDDGKLRYNLRLAQNKLTGKRG